MSKYSSKFKAKVVSVYLTGKSSSEFAFSFSLFIKINSKMGLSF